jgi:predicted transcriptional regulator
MPGTFKGFLEKISSEKAPGPSPSFSLFHMLQAIELIAEGAIGRNKLAENLKVGEGAIRTIIERLKDAGLITMSRTGCTLTNKGVKLWKEYKSVLKKIEIRKNELALAEYSSAILIKNSGNKIRSGVEQRDAAIKAGAKGATTIIFKKGCLIIPSVSSNMINDFPQAANQIIKLLRPEENDAIVIGSGNSLGEAEHGVLAAAWTLLDDC